MEQPCLSIPAGDRKAVSSPVSHIFLNFFDRRMELNVQPLPLRPNQKNSPVSGAQQQFKTLFK
jgi:hypothetical protein